MNETKNVYKGIIVMRHGERIDMKSPTLQKLSEYDPELTENGINQAKEVGNKIKQILNKEIDTINLYSSPFTRTLMTGLNMVKTLNLKNNNIFIANDLFEMATPQVFKYNPLDQLLINNKDNKKELYEEFINKDLQSINNFDKINIYEGKGEKLKYPENFNDSYNRYSQFAKDIYQKILNENKNSLNIIVTHGYGVQIITSYLKGLCCNGNDIIDQDYVIEFCTSYKFKFIDKNTLKYCGREN